MACDQIIDSYEENDDDGAAYRGAGYYIGQAFTMGDTPYDICGAKFKVDVVDNGGGVSIDVAAKIYACTGTPGTDGTRTGAALATSNTIQFTTTQTTWTEFTFSTPYMLNASTNYCIVLECMAYDGNMIVGPTSDTTSPAHAGNMCLDILFGDDYDNSNDVNFYIYYEGPDEYIKRINIENKKPTYKLTTEQPKPTHRLTLDNEKPTYRLTSKNQKPTYRLTVEAQ